MDLKRIHRVLRLIMILQSGTSLSADELARQMNVSRRTLFRDLKTLQAAGIDYEYAADEGFRLEPTVFLPPLNLKVAEALGLIILAKTAESQPGQPLTTTAIEAVNKLLMLLPDPIQRVCHDIMGRTSIRQQSVGIVKGDGRSYATLQQAIDSSEVVAMAYRSLHEDDDIEVRLRPYHLHFYARAWYVIGHSELHGEIRTFKLARIHDLEMTGEPFKRDPDFSIEAYFGNAWGMIPGERTYHIELAFTKKVATNVAEVQWHPTQQVTMLDDGRCHVTFKVDGISEISWWLLGYGDQVRVIKPKLLRDRLKKVYAAALRQYDEPS